MLAVLDQRHIFFFFFLPLSFPYFVSISICHPPLESCKSFKKTLYTLYFPPQESFCECMADLLFGMASQQRQRISHMSSSSWISSTQ